MTIRFEKAAPHHLDTIFAWLAELHMVEFWDNTQEHKTDIINFVHGRKQVYFYGTTQYWVGFRDQEPYCFVLSDIFQPDQDLSQTHRKHMSKTGHTIGLDFGIGDKKFLNQGLAAPTLEAFMHFYNQSVDPLADTFIIDPAEDNPRAQHVYKKAGFELVGTYDATAGAFQGETSLLMVKKL